MIDKQNSGVSVKKFGAKGFSRGRLRFSVGIKSLASLVLVFALAIPGAAFAVPAFVNSSSATGGTSQSTLDVPLPGTSTAGDLLVAIVAQKDATGLISPLSGGWQTVYQGVHADDKVSLGIFYKVDGGSETGPYTFELGVNNKESAGSINRYTGVDTTNPLAVAAATATANVKSATAIAPDNTTLVDNAKVLRVYAMKDNNNPTVVIIDKRSEVIHPADKISIALADQTQVTAGSTGTVDFTNLENHEWIAVTFALRELPPEADINVSKTLVTPEPINELDAVQYTVTVTNQGPNASGDFNVTDQIPSGLTFVSASATSGSYVQGTGTWSLPSLAFPGSATLTINATVADGNSGKTITNTAISQYSNDPDGTDNSDSVSFQVPGSDIAVTKSATPIPSVAGESITFTVTVTNNGPDDESADIVVNDVLPAAFTPTLVTPSAGAYDTGTGDWTIPGGLANGASATLTIEADVSPQFTGTPVNTACVTSVHDDDLNNNDCASVAIPIRAFVEDGACIIDMSADANNDGEQTFNEGLTPYGLLYNLITDGDVPILWVINPDKTDESDIDVTVNGIDYRHGPFVIPAIYVDTPVEMSNLNLPANGGVLVSFTSQLNAGNDAASVLTDGVTDDAGWSTAVNPASPQDIVYSFDSGSSALVDRVEIYTGDGDGAGDWAMDVEIYTSADGVTFFLQDAATLPAEETRVTIDFPDVDATHVRVRVLNGYNTDYWRMAEVQVYGKLETGLTARQTLAQWALDYPGFTYRCDLPSFTAPVWDSLTVWPRAVLDLDNGPIAAQYYINAGFPALGGDNDYAILGRPRDLNLCNDIYIMPHADPHTNWKDNESGDLADGTTTTVFDTIKFLKFVEAGGQLWAGCHAISAMERLVDVPPAGDWTAAGYTVPGDVPTEVTAGQTPLGLWLLSDRGLVDWNIHADASPNPFVVNPTIAADPIMQYMGDIGLGEATRGGSEQIYMPDDFTDSSDWRPETTVALYDPLQTDLFANGGDKSEGEAGVLTYGRAYGNPDYGMIMYEAGHRLDNGTVGENVAAQRAFFNFQFLTSVIRRPQIEGALSLLEIERCDTCGVEGTLTVTGIDPGDEIELSWSSTCGGIFTYPDPPAPQDGTQVIWTPPAELADITTSQVCVFRVNAEDICNRANFAALPLNVVALDVGDAPDSYEQGDPAVHPVWADGPYLGGVPDVEDSTVLGNPWSGNNADGDDTDNTPDEDGVLITFDGPAQEVVATVTASNPNLDDAKLCGYVDGGNKSPFVMDGIFNRDGSDTDEEECVTVPAGTVDGSFELRWSWDFANAGGVKSYLRLRITTDPEFFTDASPSPIGTVSNGEIEDHPFDTPTSVTIGEVSLEAMSLDTLGEMLGESGMRAMLETYSAAQGGAGGGSMSEIYARYFDPDNDGQVAVVRWDTLAEMGTVGFYLERRPVDSDTSDWVRINDRMLPALVDSPLGSEYLLLDPGAKEGVEYRYFLVEQEAWGSSNTYGPFNLQMK